MFDENKLISLMENFVGQQFQWIKTDRVELLGKIVKCKEVIPGNNGTFKILFNDNSTIDSSLLNSNLMMITQDSQPLSNVEIDHINSINKPRVDQARPRPQIQQNDTFSQSQPLPQSQPTQNMFSAFNSEESDLQITIRVKLPDKKLLKLMYANAENKEKFLSELSQYLLVNINNKVLADSVLAILSPPKIKVEKKNTININPVNE
jgi:hypothetical protein